MGIEPISPDRQSGIIATIPTDQIKKERGIKPSPNIRKREMRTYQKQPPGKERECMGRKGQKVFQKGGICESGGCINLLAL